MFVACGWGASEFSKIRSDKLQLEESMCVVLGGGFQNRDGLTKTIEWDLIL